MDNIRANGNLTSKMDEIHNCIDDKVWISEGDIKQEPCDMKDEQESILNYLNIKDEIDNLTVVVPRSEFVTDYIEDKVCLNETVISEGDIKQEPCDMKDEQGSIHNYLNIKEENIDNLTVLIPGSEFVTDYIEDKVCLNGTVISKGDIKQKPSDMKDEQRSIRNYLSMKDEIIDDPTVVVQETQVMTDCIDNKVWVCETKISGVYIKDEPCNMGDKSGSIHNNVDMKACEECGEEYDLYCLKCPMLIRIFDSNYPDGKDNTVRWTLPKNFVDIYETPSGMGIVALRIIPKGVVFGPFKGLYSTKDEGVSKWKLRNPRWLSWMQYVRIADQDSHQNLVPLQYEGGLYYRSECHINVGDELLVRWDSDSKESEIQDMEDSYCKPRVCESLDDSYACTFCCVGYKSISHLKAHNATCIEKRDKKDFCGDIIQCDICNIYLDKKEYSDYHMDRCCKSNGNKEKRKKIKRQERNKRYLEKIKKQPLEKQEQIKQRNRKNSKAYRIRRKMQKNLLLQQTHDTENSKIKSSITRANISSRCVFKSRRKRNRQGSLQYRIKNGDKPFGCTLCPYKATKKWYLEQHIAVHSGDKPFACTLCPYKAKTELVLKRHLDVHNENKPFACTLCPYKAKRKGNLKQHMAGHKKNRRFTCTLCPYKTTTKGNLKEHNAIHSNDKPFACTICPYKTTKKGHLKRHIASHNDDRPFVCALCPHTTTTKFNLKRHIAAHNNDRPFACTFCTYKATRKWDLQQHIAIHSGEVKSFACTFCPYKAKTNAVLKRHIIVHSDDNPFACILCPYKTTSTPLLKLHIAVHNNDRPFACTLCTYKARTNSKLKEHVAIHNGERPFACTFCPYTAKTKSSLKRHVALHSGDKPFVCTLCPYKTRTNFSLKLHIAVHNGDKPYACTLCPYKTTTKTKLKLHITTHNDDRPFACALCPYKGKTKANLKQHIAIHKGDKKP